MACARTARRASPVGATGRALEGPQTGLEEHPVSDPLPDYETLREIFALVTDVVILVGADRKVWFVNRLEAGYSAEDAIGVDALAFVAPGQHAQWLKHFDDVITSGQPAKLLTQVVGKQGGREWYEGTMLPIAREGRAVSVAIITKNVTERMLLETLLPVCSWCRRVRDEDGEWEPLEAYLESVSDSRVTHGMCPDCEARLAGGGGRQSA
jgi:PAS domain S-box-containing protein